MTAVKQSFFPFRDSGGIQTHNLLIRSQMLYSVELRNPVPWNFATLRSDSGGIQTHNLLIRSQMLYSVELRNHFRFAGAKVHTFFGTTKLLETFFPKKCDFTLLFAFYDSFRGIQRGYNPYAS